VIHAHSQYVKIFDGGGALHHANWSKQYNALRAASNTSRPGYLWHEVEGLDTNPVLASFGSE
jgi:hypothetical protein